MNRPGTIPTAAARFADAILITGCVVSLSICLYFAYFYYWTETRQFTTPWGPYLYYGAPLFLGVILAGTLKLRPSSKINIVLLLCSAGLAIYGLEVLATIWFKLPLVIESGDRRFRRNLADAQGIAFDTRSKREVVDDFVRGGMDAVPSIYPQGLLEPQQDGAVKSRININGTEVLPLASVAKKLTVVCNEGGQFLSYMSDDHGFNNPPDLWNSAALDVLAVGDSFTQGFCVSAEENFVAQIRKRYPATLNLGIEGDGPLTMLATLKEYAPIFRPKIVLWFYFEGNDVADLTTERLSPLLNHYLSAGFSQHLLSRQSEIDSALTEFLREAANRSEVSRTMETVWAQIKDFTRPAALENVMRLSELRTKLRLLQGHQVKLATEIASPSAVARTRTVEELMKLLSQVLLEARRSVNEWGGELYFVYLPSWDRYDPTRLGENPERNLALQVVKDLGLPLIDINQAFAAPPDPLTLFPLRIGHHYNEEGHRLVAEEVLRRITFD